MTIINIIVSVITNIVVLSPLVIHQACLGREAGSRPVEIRSEVRRVIYTKAQQKLTGCLLLLIFIIVDVYLNQDVLCLPPTQLGGLCMTHPNQVTMPKKTEEEKTVRADFVVDDAVVEVNMKHFLFDLFSTS